VTEFAKQFELPTKDQPLRFRYTSYMGEYHPAEKKVVVEFSPEDFGLTEVQRMKLRKLAGPRYNPEKETIKMSCESFEHQAQNKRYLAELVEKLLREAKVCFDSCNGPRDLGDALVAMFLGEHLVPSWLMLAEWLAFHMLSVTPLPWPRATWVCDFSSVQWMKWPDCEGLVEDSKPFSGTKFWMVLVQRLEF
jgi:hypothetical protein